MASMGGGDGAGGRGVAKLTGGKGVVSITGEAGRKSGVVDILEAELQ